MKKSVLFTATILIIWLCGGCNDQKIESFRYDDTLKIDGNAEDWKQIPTYSNEKPSLYFGVCNNDDYLNILISSKDRNFLQWVRMTGVTLWLNTEGKKKRTLGLHLYAGKPFGQRRGPDGEEPENMKTPGLSIVSEEGTVMPVDKLRNPPECKFKFDFNTVTIEYRIPINKNEPVGRIRFSPESGNELYLCLEAGGQMQRPQSGRMGRGGGMGGPGGGGPGGMGGDRGPGGGPGRMGNNSPQKAELWVKVLLAEEEQ